MSTAPTASRASGRLPAGSLPRLLPPEPRRDLAAHLDWFGELPRDASGVIAAVERAGLRGRGGAGFPTARKLAAVAERRGRTVVVANGTEGEPISTKDRTLLSWAPHLVVEGAGLAAAAVHAREAIICVERGRASLRRILDGVVAERQRLRLDPVPVRIVGTPDRYLSGEESALVHWLNGGEVKPTFVPPRPFERGVDGLPTLVNNVETLAHLALIQRFGPDWFRSLGSPAEPGSLLVTVTGAVASPGVLEAPFGAPVDRVLDAAGVEADAQAVLFGGYFGSWVEADKARRLDLSAAGLGRAHAALGCGAMFVLPGHACGLAESARVARWLSDQSAGQCGPCVHGLDAIAGAMATLVRGDKDRSAARHLDRWLELVKGRGACKLPDGAARFVASSLTVFADEIARHRRGGPCRYTARSILPTPAPGPWR